ncbi:antimicrobial response protein [Lithospermum erythrorhizon]|uniref:Antimicrobial response protein n=1 Tax=Lithospermum erythrorhizon TaxID=34254 RepID=A0AAV3Q3W9_LITER
MASVQVNDNDVVVGIEKDSNIMREYLLSGEDVLEAISVVGMVGIGKTTLALTVYSTQMNINNSNGDDEDLAVRLCRNLRKRRYLVVLDDIWDTNVWTNLKRYLPNDNNGSRILITTRIRSVALEINKSKVHELGGLTEEESWELFQKKLPRGEDLSADILKIAQGIALHCKGLPLSIVIVAELLSEVEISEKKWNELAENVTSSVFTDPQGKCKAILELSYNHLTDHLKSCFLYLGLFPEDHEISVTCLKRLWIAEGFVLDNESKNMEEVAENTWRISLVEA